MNTKKQKAILISETNEVITNQNKFFVKEFELRELIDRYKGNKGFINGTTFLAVILLILAILIITGVIASIYVKAVTPVTGLILVLLGLWIFVLSITLRRFITFLFKTPRFFLPQYENISIDLQENIPSDLKEMNTLLFLSPDALEGLVLISQQQAKSFLKLSKVRELLTRIGLEEKYVLDLSSVAIDTKLLSQVLSHALFYAIELDSVNIDVEHIFLGLLVTLNEDKQLSKKYQISFDDVIKVTEWKSAYHRLKFDNNPFNIYVKYKKGLGIADYWFTGFTFYISKMSTNIIDFLKYNPGVYNIAHKEKVIKLIAAILKPQTPNALLVGDAGTGKTSVIYGLAQNIINGDVPSVLLNKQIYSIDLNKMLANVSEVGGVPIFMKLLENELAQNPEIIFFIDDIALLLEGAINRELLIQLLSVLAKYNIPIIATMTFAEFNAFKTQYATLAMNFEVIEIPEASEDATYSILTTKVYDAERKYKIHVQFPALNEIIRLTKLYLPAQRFPKKAITVFEKACILASANSQKVLTKDIVARAVEDVSNIKVGVENKEKMNELLNLEQKIHKQYINQKNAVQELVSALKRSRMQLSNPKKPIGTFLFLGPTGVGKTYLAKVAAKEFFGENHRVIRVDMSQYKLPSDIYQILRTLSEVKLSPYSLILLDEFEKAHPEIHDIFLRMFDEGVIKDEHGEDLYFTNSIIVATSNIGSQQILEFANDYEKSKQVIKALLPQYLKPELINRFDSVIIFRPLDKEELMQVTELLLKELQQTLESQHIKLLWNDVLLSSIVEQAYDPLMGARPIKRFIEKKVKTVIADYILQYKTKYGTSPEVVDLSG